MQDILNSVIAAVSTAHGKAGIAVIRVSGEKCFDTVSRVFRAKSGKPLSEYRPSSAVYGDIYYEGEVIDTGLCTVFRAPHSYTGEDTAEISCHGNDLCASLVLSSLFAAGAVPAGPGEFTRRAFMNGKLGLTQAEAVAELIDAESTAALKLSNAKVAGRLSLEIDEISQKLTDILASVYSFIDYPDEDLADMPAEEMRSELEAVKKRLFRLCQSYASGRAVSGGVKTAIVGLPNSGKSSLLNLLLGSDRAIVTDIAGTTRDVITEKVLLGNISLVLSDTAGIRGTDDKVEQIGVRRAYASIDEAELILAVIDGAADILDGERGLLEYIARSGEKNIIVVFNKDDISRISPEKRSFIIEVLKDSAAQYVNISAKNGDGKEQLISAITGLYPAGDELLTSGLVITGARVYASVKNAYEAVCDGLRTLESYTQDVAGTDIERAVAFLSEADGRKVTEDIVNNIFSRFCVGK